MEHILSRSKRSILYKEFSEKEGKEVIWKVSSELRSTKNDLINEFEITKSLSIPGVRMPIGKGIIENREAFCYEYFDGVSLREYLVDSKKDIPGLLQIIINILKVIDCLHQKEVSHLCLNSDNILVNRNTSEIHIIDFANSANRKLVSSFDLADMGNELCYISPEQTGQFSNQIDSRSDLYSLGIICYEMFSGRTPFEYTIRANVVHDHLVKIPTPLAKLNKLIPESISEVIQKLLQKKPDDRYKTASGVRYDFLKCLENYSKGENKPFRLGEKENYSKFSLSTKLYGREKENSMLLNCLEKVSEGDSIVVFVEGEPGVGKTALLSHFKLQVEEKHCFFISGSSEKSKQNKSNLVIINALKELTVTLLSQSKTDLKEWNSRMTRAVDGMGGRLNDLIPEFKFLIGDQPIESDMSADQLMNRINFLSLRIVEEVASKTRPLVLFFDDLHQADSSLFNILQTLTTEKDIKHLMLIGCYRPEQKENNNSFHDKLRTLSQKISGVYDLKLGNIGPTDIESLINDSLHLDNSGELGQLIFSKTQGNPFFVHRLLEMVYRSNFIHFDSDSGRWNWEKEKISTLQVEDNVAEYLKIKLERLSEIESEILKKASCVGNQFQLAFLASLMGVPLKKLEEQIQSLFSENILQAGDEGTAKFTHRIIEMTAYELLTIEQKSKIHYDIAVLLSHDYKDSMEATDLFVYVNQWNRGVNHVPGEEKNKIIRLNHLAGIKAKNSGSFDIALEYFTTAARLTEESDWHSNYEQSLQVHNEAAEVSALIGSVQEMEKFISEIIKHSRTFNDSLNAHEIKVNYFSKNQQFAEGVAHLLVALEQTGYGVRRNPGKLAIVGELIKVKRLLFRKKIDSIMDLPEMTDEKAKAFLKLTVMATTSIFGYAPDILPIIIFRQTWLSLKFGNSGYSPYAYGSYGFAEAVFMGNVIRGYQFAKMADKLADKLNATYIKAKSIVVFYGFLAYWKDTLVSSIAPLEEGYKIGRKTGDYLYASFAISFSLSVRLHTGDNLIELLEKFNENGRIIKSLNQELIHQITELQRQFVINLSTGVENCLKMTSDGFDERLCLEDLTKKGDKATQFIFFYIKIALSCMFNDYKAGVEQYETASNFIEETTSRQILYPNFLLYACILNIKNLDKKPLRYSKKIHRRVERMKKQLQSFAKYGPQNFENKCSIIEALLAENAGAESKATHYFKQAILQSQKANFIHEEALSKEYFAYFLINSNNKEYGEFMLKMAFDCYHKWGAKSKCDQLQKNFPEIFMSHKLSNSENRRTNFQNDYDLNTIIKAIQVLSSENKMSDLLKKMVEVVIQNATVSNVVIILKSKKGGLVQRVIGNKQRILLISETTKAMNSLVPVSLINYVSHTKAVFVSDNLSLDNNFNFDLYIRTKSHVSVCCIPIISQGEILGVLYFENDSKEFAFDKKRIEFFTTISSQMAISLENVFLYSEMEQKVLDRTAELVIKNRELNDEKKKSDSLLLNILPAHTAQELLNFGKATPRRYPNVTVMFADIKGFTRISENIGPEELVSELDYCFRNFDEICYESGLEKIKTIGDAYMVSGGLPDNNSATSADVVKAAMRIRKFNADTIAERKKANKFFFEFRIGIHTGHVVAGVVGIKKFQFDIWGETVNIAARIEQESVAGKINISGTTYAQVKDKFKCEYRGKIASKNMDAIDMYFVEDIL